MENLQFLIKAFILTIIFGFMHIEQSNAGEYTFYVQLSDKNNSPYSISEPSTFLSKRAIERRAYYNVPIDESDLPVNPSYIQQIAETGVHILARTKWLNAVTILVKDTSVLKEVRALSFVDDIEYTGISNTSIAQLSKQKSPANKLNFDYGSASYQLDFMNARYLHDSGYMGEGIHVAVIDGGFNSVDVNQAFDVMREEGRLLGTKDFVNPNSNIYSEHVHGAYVLATMAAELNGDFVGTAPKASYWLLRSESDPGEYLFEPDLLVSAIEFADSVGVDVATTSLGYTTFDDSRMNYTYNSLDGKTARASIAANMAYKKGILLINSAGNDGNNSWKHICVPSDAEGVITVGALNSDSTSSYFSSIGLAQHNIIKPELAVQGKNIKTLSTNGDEVTNSGTSFSTPILAGGVACFLQAAKNLYPNHTLDQIKSFIYKSAHNYENPDYSMGYGIPDFEKAMSFFRLNNLDKNQQKDFEKKSAFKIIVNRNSKKTHLNLFIKRNKMPYTADVYQLDGKLILKKSFSTNLLNLDLSELKDGIYIVKIEK